MRGNIWALLVGSLGAGILLRGLSTAQPSSPGSTTQAVSGILDVLNPIAGLLIMLVAIGVLLSLMMPLGSGGL